MDLVKKKKIHDQVFKKRKGMPEKQKIIMHKGILEEKKFDEQNENTKVQGYIHKNLKRKNSNDFRDKKENRF